MERLSDMVFDARSMGMTSEFKIEKLKMIEKDDADKAVQGMSGGRKCIFLLDICGRCEERGCAYG